MHGHRFPLHKEKDLQLMIADVFTKAGILFEREYRFDDHNIVDFFVSGIAIEVKIKGGVMDILRQCSRYSEFKQVNSIILVTNKSMGFPQQINKKDAFLFNISKAWL